MPLSIRHSLLPVALAAGLTAGPAQALTIGAYDSADNLLGTVDSFSGPLDAAANYNYGGSGLGNWSADPIHGPDPQADAAVFYFYDGLEGLSLGFTVGRYRSGPDWRRLRFDLTVDGNLTDTQVLAADENQELKELGASDRFRGRFRYKNNTDGGVVGPLAGQDWTLDLDLLMAEGLRALTLADAAGGGLALFADADRVRLAPLAGSAANDTPIPLPGTALLALLGLAGLAGGRRLTLP